jgi:putative inorganic carbon (hco3(-)) transporter
MRLQTYQWGAASYLGRLMGLLQSWYPGSQLLQWGEGISAGLLSLVFGLAPFVPNSMIGVLLVACGGFWLLLTLASTPQQRLNPIHLLVLLYWGIATVATGLSPVRSAAFSGWTKFTLYLFFFALIERLIRSPRWRSWMITVYLLVALVVSVEGIRQQIFGAPPLATWTDPTSAAANTTRVYSFLGNPNLLAGYILPAICLSIGAVFAWRGVIPKFLALVMVGMNLACLYFTQSRGGWMGTAIALFIGALLLLYWLLPRLPQFWRIWAFPILIGGLAGLVMLALVLSPTTRARVLTIFADRTDSSNNFRINVWASVRNMIRDRPILGIGPGNVAFNRIYPLYQAPGYTALSAYSIYLEILVEVGLVGFLAFLWLLVTLGQQAWLQVQQLRSQNSREIFWLISAIAILAGMLTHGAVDTIWYRPEVATLWWFTVALISSYLSPMPSVSSSNLNFGSQA